MKQTAAAGRDLVECLGHRHRVAVWAGAEKRVEHVDHRHHTCLHGNRVAGEAVRIARPIRSLVVGQGDRRRHLEQRVVGPCQHLVADQRVTLHRAPFVVGQRSPLQEHLIRDCNLTDVVQRRGNAHQLGSLRLPSHVHAQGFHHRAHPAQVAAHPRYATFGRECEPGEYVASSVVE